MLSIVSYICFNNPNLLFFIASSLSITITLSNIASIDGLNDAKLSRASLYFLSFNNSLTLTFILLNSLYKFISASSVNNCSLTSLDTAF